MFNEVKTFPPSCIVAFFLALYYSPVKKSKNKLKKVQKKLKVLEMKQNVDILDFRINKI